MSDATIRQPRPKKGDQTVWTEVMSDLAERVRLGKTKYGTELESNNGRDALVDLYQELLDAAQYCKQRILEGRIRSASIAGLPTLELFAIANLTADAILADNTSGENACSAAQSIRDHVPKASPTITLRILTQCIAEINDRRERLT